MILKNEIIDHQFGSTEKCLKLRGLVAFVMEMILPNDQLIWENLHLKGRKGTNK